MTFTKTLMMSAAAAAFIMASGGAAWAQEELPPLPNAKWSYGEPVVTTSIEQIILPQGNSGKCREYNVTTTTTTFPAINPGGNAVEDKSVTTTTLSDPQNAGGPSVDCPE